MELIPGVEFRKWLRKKKNRSWSEVVSILILAAKGLQAAHDAGVLHRDFKPDSILINANVRPYVSDFGLAVSEYLQRLSLPVEQSGSQNDLVALSSFRRSGTPGYLAPEYLEYGLYDEKSDHFAFGVTLYESVYGKRPFSYSLVHEQLIEIERGPRFPRRSPPVPKWLEHVIARCLHPDASKRWSSVCEIADALRSGIIRPRQRRQFLFQAACALVVAASVFAVIPSASVHRCQTNAVEKSPCWNAPRALKIRSHFESFADRNGAAVFDLIEEKLNDRYEHIQQAYLELCKSTLDTFLAIDAQLSPEAKAE